MDSLEDEAAGSGPAGSNQGPFVGESGQDQHTRFRGENLDMSADFDTGAIRQIEVQHDYIGLIEPDPAHRLFGGSGFSDNLEVRLGFDQSLEAVAHEFMVVDHHQPDDARGAFVETVLTTLGALKLCCHFGSSLLRPRFHR